MGESHWDDKAEDNSYLEQASHGRRLANYLIDIFVFIFLLLVAMDLYTTFVGPEFLHRLEKKDPSANLQLQLIVIFFYPLYYAFSESLFKGKTVGKMFTNTRAIYQDGSPVNAKKAFERALCRMVPLYFVSGLTDPCRPWHDSWTDTYVIHENRTA